MFETPKSPIHVNKVFIVLLILSVFIHVVALLQINWNSEINIPKEKLLEVDLFTLKIPPPPPVIKESTRNLEATVNKKTVSNMDGSLVIKDNKPTTSDNSEVLKVKKVTPKPVIKKPTLAVQSQLSGYGEQSEPNAKLKLSEKQLEIPEVKSSQTSGSPSTQQIVEQVAPIKEVVIPKKSSINSPQLQNVEVNKLVKTDISGEVKSQDFSDNINKINDSRQQQLPPGNGEKVEETGHQQGLKIEGEISSRKVIYKPDAPQLNLDRDITVILRFTVLPNGEVDQVFPFQKAEPELERIAIEMLHQYRFEPLFGSNIVQNGIIHFTLFRKK
ncbi:hypothetical protein KJ966_22210 [bacterium]|nr:hypothetical protein [bacterium]